MTEAEWLESYLVRRLLCEVWRDDGTSDRKLRLFSLACFRRAVEYLPDPVLCEAVEVCERWVNDPLAPALRTAEHRVRQLETHPGYAEDEAFSHLIRAARALFGPPGSAEYVADMCRDALCGHDDFYAGRGELLFQADLLRDIFYNPFRPVAFDPEWRTPAAIALAGTMYEARDFCHMPVLADALDDAGCDHPDVIAHCRGPNQVHVRGCWVVDLVLGKT